MEIMEPMSAMLGTCSGTYNRIFRFYRQTGIISNKQTLEQVYRVTQTNGIKPFNYLYILGNVLQKLLILEWVVIVTFCH